MRVRVRENVQRFTLSPSEEAEQSARPLSANTVVARHKRICRVLLCFCMVEVRLLKMRVITRAHIETRAIACSPPHMCLITPTHIAHASHTQVSTHTNTRPCCSHCMCCARMCARVSIAHNTQKVSLRFACNRTHTSHTNEERGRSDHSRSKTQEETEVVAARAQTRLFVPASSPAQRHSPCSLACASTQRLFAFAFSFPFLSCSFASFLSCMPIHRAAAV